MAATFGHRTFYGRHLGLNQPQWGLQGIFHASSALRTLEVCPRLGLHRGASINTDSDIGHLGHPYGVAASPTAAPIGVGRHINAISAAIENFRLLISVKF